MKLHIDKEWLRRKIEAEEEGEVGAGFESAFVDASVFVDFLRDSIKPPHDPKDQELNNPNIFKYEEDDETSNGSDS